MSIKRVSRRRIAARITESVDEEFLAKKLGVLDEWRIGTRDDWRFGGVVDNNVDTRTHPNMESKFGTTADSRAARRKQ